MKNYISKIPLGNNKFAYEQDVEFRERGKAYISEIQPYWKPPKNYYHLLAGGHIKAIKQHLGSQYFSNIDLSRFYYRVSKNKVLRSLKKIGMSFSSSDQIARESVIKTGDGLSLPYGFVQSPILSSVVLDKSNLGDFISSIPNEYNTTVYVDDIILSHKDKNLLEKISKELIETAANTNFPINPEKTVIADTMITSFNIQISNGLMEITSNRMNSFYVFLNANPNEFQVSGVLDYVRQINSDQFNELQSLCMKRNLI